MENLIWKPVVGYEGLYEVSNTGLIKSLNCYNYKEPRIMKLGRRPDGYLSVGLSKNNVTKTKTVHRIVAEAFIPNPDNLEMVNHKDEDRANNNVENLEWCTRAYNQNYSMILHPERKKVFGNNFKNKDGSSSSPWTKKGIPHKHNNKVAIIDDDNNVIKQFDNPSMAAKIMNLESGNILSACKRNALPDEMKKRKRGKRKVKGYIFVFVQE